MFWPDTVLETVTSPNGMLVLLLLVLALLVIVAFIVLHINVGVNDAVASLRLFSRNSERLGTGTEMI